MRRLGGLRRALLGFLLLVGALAVGEVVGWVGLLLTGGGMGEVAGERGRVVGGEEGGEGVLAELGAGPGGIPREVLHPFVGFVFDPALNEAEGRREAGRLEVTELGFFRPPGPPPPPDPQAVRVAVFGGSVAFVLSFEARGRLESELAAALTAVPELAGRPVEVESFALGGYKQPQQLATFAWLLARGHHFDLVLNLDGFNEVVLPSVENLRQQTALDYPRSWRRRVAGAEDPATLRRAGATLLLREQRRAWARTLSAAPWRWSPTAQLLWRVRDQRLARHLAELELASEERQTAGAGTDAARSPGGDGPGYLATGPFEPPASRATLFDRLADLWAESSRQMDALAAANGAAYYHFLQPNQYAGGGKPLGPEERSAAFDADHPYRPPVEAGYPRLRRAGRELAAAGVEFHDLTEVFAGVEAPLYVDTCCHLNREGSERLAAAMAAAVGEDAAAGTFRRPSPN